MTGIVVEFRLDTRGETEKIKISSPYAELDNARNDVETKLRETAKGSGAMMRVRDAESGDHIFVNTMKLSNVSVREE